jgi:hypothetical protein
VARPDYTARPQEALLIVRNADGMLEIGSGRVRIAPGAAAYFRRIIMALTHVLDLPGGPEAFERGDSLGHPVTIMQPPARPPSIAPKQGQLQLSCHPAKVDDALVFPCLINNPGPSDVFVMDGVASLDRETRSAYAIEPRSVLIDASGDAIIGRFIPPMPTDRQIATPVVPLARRLPPGGELERRVEIPAPYAETSPWLPDLPTAISGVVLAIGYWPAGSDGLAATEAPYAPGFHVISPACVGSLVTQRFPTTGLRFLQRTDGLPRSPG